MQRMQPTQLVDHLQTQSPLLLDVREPWEFEICRIDGSVNIPMEQIPQQLAQLRDAGEIIVICHHGVRSQQVIMFLHQYDIDNLVNLDGGVDAWARNVDPDMPVY